MFRRFILYIVFVVVGLVGFHLSAYAQLDRNYFYRRGSDNIMDGQYSEAIDVLNILLRTDSRSSEGYFLRGVAKFNLNDLSGAYVDLTRAIQENPVYTLAYQYRGITLSAMGDHEAAIVDFDRAIEMRPGQPGSYYSRGMARFMTRQFDGAIRDYDQFIRMEPTEADGYINRGNCYLQLSDTTAAMKDFQRAVEVRPYYKVGYLRRGMIYLMRQQLDPCVVDMSKAISLDTTFAPAYFYRSMAYSTLGKLNNALSDLDNAVRYDPENSITYFKRAMIRTQVGDYNRAIEDYDHVARTNPTNLLVYYNRAGVYAQIGHYKAALADYDRALELYPDFANAYLNRSQMWAALGNFRNRDRDVRTAKAKISEYRDRVTPAVFQQYADTSATFGRLLDFDANLGDVNSSVRSSARSKLRGRDLMPKPMFRFAVDTAVSVWGGVPVSGSGMGFSGTSSGAKSNAVNAVNALVDRFIDSMYVPNLKLTTSVTSCSVDSLRVLAQRREAAETLDTLNLNHTAHSSDFAKLMLQALTLTADRQYSASLDLWRHLRALQSEFAPFVLINSAVTAAEMVGFVASLDDNTQSNLNFDTQYGMGYSNGMAGFSSSSSSNASPNSFSSSEHKIYDYSQAIDDLLLAAQLMPGMAQIYYNLGNLYAASGDLPAAIRNYGRALELQPEMAECYYNRALVHLKLGEDSKADMDLAMFESLCV